jgi:hypothetical protein
MTACVDEEQVRFYEKRTPRADALGVRSMTERLGCRGMGSPPRSRVLDSEPAEKTELTFGTRHCYLGVATASALPVRA